MVDTTQPQSGEHDDAFIPVTVYGKFLKIQSSDSEGAYYPLEIWCCFLDAQTGELLCATQKARPLSSSCYDLGEPIACGATWGDKKMYRDHLARKKERNGMQTLGNHWVISPKTGRLVYQNVREKEVLSRTLIRNVGQNGFGPGPYSDVPTGAIHGKPHEPVSITERLAHSNPIVASWFFES